jgi:hypothetical protein
MRQDSRMRGAVRVSCMPALTFPTLLLTRYRRTSFRKYDAFSGTEHCFSFIARIDLDARIPQIQTRFPVIAWV